ncbi:hypothetical protein RvY_17011 [Ramazzottius varieornatus]|uniref:Eyes absent homolog n=1 Tax=Ramazzottius varieornatus TaxID=947166 RepID=A0A1D1W0L2_RAMVA|nr:hypothetical protein RvY_17011 [Ramazzottius varieornatus]
MQAYPSMGSSSLNGANAYASLQNAVPSHPFYNSQSSPAAAAAIAAYSGTILPTAYGRNLKQGSQGGASSAAASYLASPYASSFPVQSVVNGQTSAYSSYATPTAYNPAAFATAPGCSSPASFQQQALDYTYGTYGGNHTAAHTHPAYAYYSAQAAGYPQYCMSAAQAAQAVQQHHNATLNTSPNAASVSPTAYLQATQNNQETNYGASSVASGATPSPPLTKEGTTQNGSSKKSRSSKSRGRRQANPSPLPESETMERVFVWNLDETIVLLHSILHPDMYDFSQKIMDHSYVKAIAMQMEQMMEDVANEYFFAFDLMECDQVHIDDVATDDNGQDLSTYNFSADGFRAISPNGNLCMASGMRGGIDWMRKLAFRYRRIKEMYNFHRNNPSALLGNSMKREAWMELRKSLDELTSQWCSLATICLSTIARRPKCANVLVTGNQLPNAVAKVLLFGLGPVFPVENIYSSTKVGKDTCFERINHRFGKNCTYVVVGNGPEEESAAKENKFPFWRVNTLKELRQLHTALEQGHL